MFSNQLKELRMQIEQLWSSKTVRCLCLILSCCFVAYGQSPVPAGVRTSASVQPYDVVSVKPNAGVNGTMRIGSDRTRFWATNVSLVTILENAYGTRDDLISDLPEWARNRTWDIEAKIVDPDQALLRGKPTREYELVEYRTRLQMLLADRFGLRVHREDKRKPVYDLVVGKNGVKFKAALSSEEGHGSLMTSMTSVSARAVPMKSLTTLLGYSTGRNIVDKTGLQGEYDIDLHWTPDDSDQPSRDSAGVEVYPTLPIALQEQLGLRLVSDAGMVSTIVIDKLQKPDAD
jgi:uncharacterized protein (TIGR03435 family)